MGFNIEFPFSDHYPNKILDKPIRMYRGNKSLYDIIQQFKGIDIDIKDDSDKYEESCDAFSTCGVDN
jgi:hypothetical protein